LEPALKDIFAVTVISVIKEIPIFVKKTGKVFMTLTLEDTPLIFNSLKK
jgi:hypothetical protein